jgi:hypothetical protein
LKKKILYKKLKRKILISKSNYKKEEKLNSNKLILKKKFNFTFNFNKHFFSYQKHIIFYKFFP